MWDSVLVGIEDIFNGYYSSFEMIAKDIREGIDEGFIEGFREGIKQGFVEGVKECKSKGFDNIEVGDLDHVLKYTLETGSNESARDIIKQAVSDEYWMKIEPSFKQKMDDAYYGVVEEIRNTDFEVNKKPASYINNCLDAPAKKIMEGIGDVCGGVREFISEDEIFMNFFCCLQNEFNRDLGKNLKAYEKRICAEIENKIDSECPDHE